MFDVSLASALKKNFATCFRKQLHVNILNNTGRSGVANVRHAEIHGAITARSAVCTSDACLNAAQITGTYPCDKNVVLESPYMKPVEGLLADLYRRKLQTLSIHYTISNKVLTQYINLAKVVEIVKDSEHHDYLCKPKYLRYQCRDDHHCYPKNAKHCVY